MMSLTFHYRYVKVKMEHYMIIISILMSVTGEFKTNKKNLKNAAFFITLLIFRFNQNLCARNKR